MNKSLTRPAQVRGITFIGTELLGGNEAKRYSKDHINEKAMNDVRNLRHSVRKTVVIYLAGVWCPAI